MNKTQIFLQELEHPSRTDHLIQSSSAFSQLLRIQDATEQIYNDNQHYRSDIEPNLPDLSRFGVGTCEICAQTLNLNRIPMQKFCCNTHKYCLRCILSVLHQNLNNFKVIKCPDPECQVQLNQFSPFYGKMMEYHKSKLLRIRKNRTVLQNPQIKLCRKEYCDGILNPDNQQCSECQQKHCSKCLQLFHDGKCDKFVKGGLKRKYQFKLCPHCRMMIQKSKGCIHMKCICGCEFCYQCGDLYTSYHKCTQNAVPSFLDNLRLNVFNQDHEINKLINCHKIMQLLQPDFEANKSFKYVYFFVIITILYPLTNAIILSLAVASLGLYMASFMLIGTLFFIALPLMEVVNLQLAPSVYLSRKGIPSWLLRILVIPLFPINLLSGIKERFRQVLCDQTIIQKLKALLLPAVFFLLLPCLLLQNQIEDELE